MAAFGWLGLSLICRTASLLFVRFVSENETGKETFYHMHEQGDAPKLTPHAKKEHCTLPDLCMSSLHRGHAHRLCTDPVFLSNSPCILVEHGKSGKAHDPVDISERKRHINFLHINFLCRLSAPGLWQGQTRACRPFNFVK